MNKFALSTLTVMLALWATVAQAVTVREYAVRNAKQSKLPEIDIPKVTLGDWRTLNYDSIIVKPSFLYMPLIFQSQRIFTDSLPPITFAPDKPLGLHTLNANDEWLNNAIWQSNHVSHLRYDAMISNPQLALYNMGKLPEPPKEYVIYNDPSKSKLTVPEPAKNLNTTAEDRRKPVKKHHWLHTFQSSLQFAQMAKSHNWFQGGDNYMSLVDNTFWTVNLNQAFHPKYIFNNTLTYQVGVNTVKNDSLRNFQFNNDQLKYNGFVGIKAIKRWYYTFNVAFSTQLFNRYVSNTKNLQSAFLSPANLNLSVGMSYNYANKTGDRTFSASFGVFSYDLKYLRNNERINPVSQGIKAGHHHKDKLGNGTIQCNFNWKFNTFISWQSQFYMVSPYKRIADVVTWDNTFNFYVSRHLSTTLVTHMRYDRSAPKDRDWKRIQVQELLSFGLVYRFATD